MNDQHTELLLNIQRELSTNTETCKGINTRLDVLNGKVANHSKQISKITLALVIVGTAVGTILVSSGSEFVDFILKLI